MLQHCPVGVPPLPHDWAPCGVPWQRPEVELFLQGPLSVVVTYGGDPIPKSPFPVIVAPPLQLGKVKVQGLNSSECGHWGNGGCRGRGAPCMGCTVRGAPWQGLRGFGSTLGEETLEGTPG